ncbi:hypothetical protein LshimejAT787_0804560 [Lyophyllum shimeji]|uniref:Uncharacterized protein n=1 Tax=Lyophyllum shimeji TaxID=47721 RepID=A0A9P3UQV1_LYOSH|nr:hypothetical protein LshimejAT787_0804560 [Lyophyllum shimeji]
MQRGSAWITAGLENCSTRDTTRSICCPLLSTLCSCYGHFSAPSRCNELPLVPKTITCLDIPARFQNGSDHCCYAVVGPFLAFRHVDNPVLRS